MSHPYVHRRVKVTGTSKAELNNQQGLVKNYSTDNMRYTVALDNGRSVALKPANLIPIDNADEAASGGIPGMSGIPAMSGMPDLSKLMGMMPPWLMQKLMRGEIPGLDDAERLLHSFLPPGVTLMHIGGATVLFLAMTYKLGFMKTLVLFGLVGFILFLAHGAFSRAGGGINGVKAGGQAVGEYVSDKIFETTKQKVSYNVGLGVAVVALLGVLYYVLFAGFVSSLFSFGSSGNDYSYDEPPITASEAYSKGFEDGSAGRPRDWSSHVTLARQKFEENQKYHGESFSSAPSGSSGFSLGSLFGGGGGFGIGKLMSLGFFARQVYTLGSVPGGSWSMELAYANFMNQNTMQKCLFAFMLLRLFGISPI